MKRQSIIDSIKTRLETITVANGYSFDLGLNVHDFQVEPENEDTLPFVNIKDGLNTIDRIGDSYWSHNLEVSIAIACSGDTSEQDIRTMINDVYTAIGTDTTFNNLVHKTIPRTDNADSEVEDSKFSWAEILLTVVYGTEAWEI